MLSSSISLFLISSMSIVFLPERAHASFSIHFASNDNKQANIITPSGYSMQFVSMPSADQVCFCVLSFVFLLVIIYNKFVIKYFLFFLLDCRHLCPHLRPASDSKRATQLQPADCRHDSELCFFLGRYSARGPRWRSACTHNANL